MLQAAVWSLSSFVLFRFNIVEMLYNAQSASIGLDETFSARNYSKIHIVISLVFGVIMVFVLYRYYLITVFILHLFFIPQILKNLSHNDHGQTDVFNISLLGSFRFIFILQIFGTPVNILHEAPRLGFCFIISMLIIFQMTLLALQTTASIKFGPEHQARVREYAYFRNKEQEIEIPASDCSICMQGLCLGDQMDSMSEEMRTLHTPCGHLFHKICLTHWMEVNPICPMCRNDLPIFDMDYEVNVLNHRET